FRHAAPARTEPSAKGLQHLAAGLNGLGGDQHEGDDARLGAAVDPIVYGAALDDDIAGLEMRHVAGLKLHVDLALHDDGIIERVRAVDAGSVARLQFEDAKDRAVIMGRAGLPEALIGGAGVVDREAFTGPDDASLRARPGRTQVLGNFVDLNDGLPLGVVT